MIRSTWRAHGRPNHGRPFFSKSSQNPSKNFPKHSPNPPKTLPKYSQNPSRTPLQNGAREKIDFFCCFAIFGRPGASQNRAKIATNRKKIEKIEITKPHVFLTPFVLDFSPSWLPKTKPKSMFFRYFFKNVDFVKIVLPSRRNYYFHVSSLRKTVKNRCQHQPRKKHRKKPLKNRFSPPSWPPQTS